MPPPYGELGASSGWPDTPGLPVPEQRTESASAMPPAPGLFRPSANGRRTVWGDRRFPRYRLLGLIAATAIIAVVGALGLPGAGAPPPDPAPITPLDGSVAGDVGAGGGSVTRGPEATGEPGAGSAGPATAGADAVPVAPDRGILLAVRDLGRLGPVVVDANGFTLYRYDGDASGTATCTDACVSTWAPATVNPNARLTVEGIEPAEVGLVRRRDGDVQLTVKGWPVYRFVGDNRPGLHGGQGIGRAWYAITPTGGKASEP